MRIDMSDSVETREVYRVVHENGTVMSDFRATYEEAQKYVEWCGWFCLYIQRQVVVTITSDWETLSGPNAPTAEE